MPKPPVSGLRMHFRIEQADGSIIDAKTAMIDILRWEKANGGQSYFANVSVTTQLALAYYAGRRLQVIPGPHDPDGWAASVVDFEVIDPTEEEAEADATALDPTLPAPSEH